jgi:hypothetical protein
MLGIVKVLGEGLLRSLMGGWRPSSSSWFRALASPSELERSSTFKPSLDSVYMEVMLPFSSPLSLIRDLRKGHLTHTIALCAGITSD